MLRPMIVMSATPLLSGEIRCSPRPALDEYLRCPNSFANMSVSAFGLSTV